MIAGQEQVEMIDVPTTFADHIIRVYGQAGAEWLETLPNRFHRLLSDWRLVPDGPPSHGGKALVLPVLAAGQPAALKVSWLNRSTRAEAVALRYWDGRGAVRVLRSDSTTGALLLERLDSARTMADLSNDEAAKVAGQIIRRTAIRAMPELPTVAAQVSEIVSLSPSYWERAGRPYPRQLLDRVLALAGSLPASTNLRMVNCDLWDGNVLAAAEGDDRWVMIDPTPLAGDPEYGLAQVLWHRADRIDTPVALDRFIGILCEVAGLDRELAWSWSIVRTADFWLWTLDHGMPRHAVGCERLLNWLTADG